MNPQLEMACETHTGRVRSHNEDCVAADEAAALAVLADGMGGHNAGEVASRLAVAVVAKGIAAHSPGGRALDAPGAEALIAQLTARANATVHLAGQRDPRCRGMGTTLVVVLWHEAGVSFGHVGDSRLYLLRADTLSRMTRDHTLIQELLDAGRISAAQARLSPQRHILTRALGTDTRVEADVRTAPCEEGDVYLVCSDGLTDMLTDAEIRDTLVADGHRVDRAARHLVAAANERGGVDNISVIVARVGRHRAPSAP